ncbi:MAG: hypothetical protein AB7F75_10920 [Planctomycetota bacterium]
MSVLVKVSALLLAARAALALGWGGFAGPYFPKYPLLGLEFLQGTSGAFSSSPFYIVLTAMVEHVLGVTSPEGFDTVALVMRMLQLAALMACALSGVIWCAHHAGLKAGWAALALWLLVSSPWVHACDLLSDVWTLPLATLFLLGRGPMITGLAAGLLAVIRPVWLILFLSGPWRYAKGGRRLGSFALAFFLPVFPALWHNVLKGEVSLTTSGPFLLYSSHNASARAWGYAPPSELVYRQQVEQSRGNLFPLEHRLSEDIVKEAWGPQADVAEVYKDVAAHQVAADGGRFLARLLRRAQALLHPYVYHDTSAIAAYQMPGLPLVLLLPLALAGWMRVGGRRAILLVAGVLITTLVFYASERLRLPLYALIPVAAVGAQAAFRLVTGRLHGHHNPRVPLLAGAAVALAIWLLPNDDLEYLQDVVDHRFPLEQQLSMARARGDRAGEQKLAKDILKVDPFNGFALLTLNIPQERPHPLLEGIREPDDFSRVDEVMYFANAALLKGDSAAALSLARRASEASPAEPRFAALELQATLMSGDNEAALKALHRGWELGLALEHGGLGILRDAAHRLGKLQ